MNLAFESHTFEGDGYAALLSSEQWIVAILNWKPPAEQPILKPDTIYNVPAGVWLDAITSRDMKLMIVENRDTQLNDTETRPVTAEELATRDAQLLR